MSRSQARLLFASAALWNVAAATVALLAPDFHRGMFFVPTTGPIDTIARVDTQAFWVTVLFFGVGYGIVARDPDRNHALVFIAALGKIYVFFAWSWHWHAGEMTRFALFGAVGDLVFAALFLWFLRSTGRRISAGRTALE